jgi:dihydrofolate reductase
MRKIVFSKTLKRAEWNNSEVLSEIDPDVINRLKQEPGKDMLIYGSASIVQQLPFWAVESHSSRISKRSVH